MSLTKVAASLAVLLSACRDRDHPERPTRSNTRRARMTTPSGISRSFKGNARWRSAKRAVTGCLAYCNLVCQRSQPNQDLPRAWHRRGSLTKSNETTSGGLVWTVRMQDGIKIVHKLFANPMSRLLKSQLIPPQVPSSLLLTALWLPCIRFLFINST